MSKGERIRNEISFNGIDGLESPEFIQAVRIKAFDENKADDYRHLTNLAAMCFVGPALRWFENLGDDIRTNWALLRPALLERFPASNTNQEGTTSRSLTFAGGSPEECEEFVRSVRKHSYLEGKFRDDEWTADYAASCMARGALRWYAKLDAPVRSSWAQLERALLAYFPEPPPYGLAPTGKALIDGLWMEEEMWLREARERRAAYDSAGSGVYPVDGGTYVVRCKATNTVLDNYGWCNTIGQQIVVWQTNGKTNQRWKLAIKPNSDQYYFCNLHSERMLGCAAALTPSVPCTLQQIPTHFQIMPLGDGLYSFCVPLTNYVLDITGGDPANGTKVILHPSHGGPNQQFYLDRY